MRLTPAEKKLKERGYKRKIIKDEEWGIVAYRYNFNNTIFLDFDLLDADVSTWGVFAGHTMTTSVDMEMLEIINERCVELGWKE